ncbi:MAG: Peptidase [Pedosphaera sp.]|nr:Peptidase [Pedosphaera sp.]
MKFLRRIVLSAGALALLAGFEVARADVTNPPPDFKEVYDLIRSNLPNESEADLDRAAVQGLLAQLHSKVSLLPGKHGTNASSEAALLTKTVIYDGPVAYLRVGRVDDGLANQIATAYKQLLGTNHLKGIVLDLRFADGRDYSAAASAADLFISNETPLLDWGTGPVKSKAKADAITLPVAVLVNQQTAAASEALAAILRETDRAVILGMDTAGEATVGKDFPLKNGQLLQIATSPIKLGDGQRLSDTGVKPDIKVAVSPQEERAYFADPFRQLPSSIDLLSSFGGSTQNSTNATNRTARQRTSEADLIRERKERPGMELQYSSPSGSESAAEPGTPVVRDPVLGRALDLVKGISVMHESHSR